MRIVKSLTVAVFAALFSMSVAQAAGFRSVDVPADAGGPVIKGAVWYPCAQASGEFKLGRMTLPGVMDCPVNGNKLPLVVISHGKGGGFSGHHDTAEALADAGFVVASLSHPGDTVSDLSRSGDLAIFVQRPMDVKRLIDYMLKASTLASSIDPARIGFFGFSRGGYTGLALAGAMPDWNVAAEACKNNPAPACDPIRRGEFPHFSTIADPRIKAAVIADPLAVMFSKASYGTVKIPVQLWASEMGSDGVEPTAVAQVDQGLPEAHEFHVVHKAAHFAFLAPCSAAMTAAVPEICVDQDGFDRIAFHKQLNAAVLAFFRKHL